MKKAQFSSIFAPSLAEKIFLLPGLVANTLWRTLHMNIFERRKNSFGFDGQSVNNQGAIS